MFCCGSFVLRFNSKLCPVSVVGDLSAVICVDVSVFGPLSLQLMLAFFCCAALLCHVQLGHLVVLVFLHPPSVVLMLVFLSSLLAGVCYPVVLILCFVVVVHFQLS